MKIELTMDDLLTAADLTRITAEYETADPALAIKRALIDNLNLRQENARLKSNVDFLKTITDNIDTPSIKM